MTKLTMAQLSKKMGKLDFAVMSTRGDGGLTGRPMSNNGDVEYEGTSRFFSYEDSRKVRDIEADDRVSLGYTGAAGLLGGPPLFVVVEGRADLVRDTSAFAEHWTKDLDRYFPDGAATPGIVVIRVRAERLRFWDGADEGEIKVDREA